MRRIAIRVRQNLLRLRPSNNVALKFPVPRRNICRLDLTDFFPHGYQPNAALREIQIASMIQALGKIQSAAQSALKGESLRAKIFRGGTWLAFGSVTEQAVRFARNILLVRLLAPEAFGVMAVVMSATSILQSLTDVGAP